MKKLSDKQKKSLDKTGDGKLTKTDFLLVRKLKNKNKNKNKNEKAQSQSDENSEETFRTSFQKTHGHDEEAYA